VLPGSEIHLASPSEPKWNAAHNNKMYKKNYYRHS
jgi:hypothetical protein